MLSLVNRAARKKTQLMYTIKSLQISTCIFMSDNNHDGSS